MRKWSGRLFPIVLALVVLAGLIFAAPVFASKPAANAQQKGNNDPGGNCGYAYRPGWGYGDDNHIHTGPPGQSK